MDDAKLKASLIKDYKNLINVLWEKSLNTGIRVEDVMDAIDVKRERVLELFAMLFKVGALSGINHQGKYIPTPKFQILIAQLAKELRNGDFEKTERYLT